MSSFNRGSIFDLDLRISLNRILKPSYFNLKRILLSYSLLLSSFNKASYIDLKIIQLQSFMNVTLLFTTTDNLKLALSLT